MRLTLLLNQWSGESVSSGATLTPVSTNAGLLRLEGAMLQVSSEPLVPVSDLGQHFPGVTTPRRMRRGKMRPAVLLWALGVPIPFILIVFLIRGCM